MPTRTVVVFSVGPAWVRRRGSRRQAYWDGHAAFIDDLTDRGLLVAGGPFGDESAGMNILASSLRRADVEQRASTGQRAAVPTLVLVSDGRANVALANGDPFADALARARLLRAAGIGAVVVDTEDGPIRLGRARILALELGAEYVRLADLSAAAPPDTALAATVRDQPRRLRP